jgi:ribonuclease HII
VAFVSPQEIDEINILRASFTAMHRAIDQLTTRPEALLIDGNRFIKYQDIPHTCIVKGDGKMMSIAAASVLAKTHRDEYMQRIAQDFPQYAWDKNKGYPTPAHRAAIELHGATPHHRMSFQLLNPQLTLF